MMDYMKRFVPDDIDMREGSLLSIVLSAAAMQFSMLTAEMDVMFESAYPDTAGEKNLDRLVKMLDITRRKASKAIVRVDSDTKLEVGERFIGGDYRYSIISVEDGYYLAECSTYGEAPNSYIGELVPLSAFEGAANIRVTEVVSKGLEEESDEQLRERFYQKMNYPVFAGNMNYYRQVVAEIEGIAGVKIIPPAEGGGEIRAVVIDKDLGVPSEELLNYVQNFLDPKDKRGMGCGKAPIGHKVTAEAAEPVDILIKIKVKTKGDDPLTAVRYAKLEVPPLLKELNKTWSSSKNIVLRDSFFEDYFLNKCAAAKYIDDVEIMSINGEANRLILDENQIIGGFDVGLDNQ